jgi:hypothetical protein
LAEFAETEEIPDGKRELDFHAQSGNPADLGQSVVKPDMVIAPTTGASEEQPKTELDVDTGVSLYRQFDTYQDQTPRTLLERQYVFDKGTWTSASGANIANWDFPYALQNVTMLWDSLLRFQWFSCDIEIQIRLNTNELMAGQLAAVYYPMYNALKSWYPTRVSNFAQSFCGSDMVIFDAATREVITITIPMLSPGIAYSKSWVLDANLKGIGGHVEVRQLAPLTQANATTTVSVEWTAFIQLKNVKTFGFVGQSGRSSTGPKRKMKIATKDPVSKEAANKTSEPKLSTALDTAGFVTAALSSIPVAGPALGAASGVLGGLSLASKYTGNSLSRDSEGYTTMVANAVSSFANTDGRDGSTVMGLAVDSKVSNEPHLIDPSPVDYNQIVNYGMLPGLHTIFTFTTATAVGSTILSLNVGPGVHTTTATTMTPSLLLSCLHTWWRGGMKIKVDFVGTAFSTARIRAVWLPQESASVTITDNNIGEFASELIDVKGTTSYEVMIPYLSTRPYLHCGDPRTTIPADELYNGNFKLIVVNPLNTANNNQTETMTVIVWTSCAEDMLFSGLREPWCYPAKSVPSASVVVPKTEKQKREEKVRRAISRITDWKADDESLSILTEMLELNEVSSNSNPHFRAQSGSADLCARELRTCFRRPFKPMLDASHVVLDRICMSDHSTTWVQMLSRPMYLQDITLQPSDVADTVDISGWPNAVSYAWQWATAAFQIIRGSVRLKFVPKGSCPPGRVFIKNIFGYDDPYITARSTDALEGMVVVDTNTRRIAEIQLPMYFQWLFYTFNFPALIFTQKWGVSLWYLPDVITSTTNLLAYAFISAGDDFSVGMPSSLPSYVQGS